MAARALLRKLSIAIVSSVNREIEGRWVYTACLHPLRFLKAFARDATRQTATLARWVRAIGDVSALVVHDAASAADPAAIHHIGLPLAFQDGLAVDHQEVMW